MVEMTVQMDGLGRGCIPLPVWPVRMVKDNALDLA